MLLLRCTTAQLGPSRKVTPGMWALQTSRHRYIKVWWWKGQEVTAGQLQVFLLKQLSASISAPETRCQKC